MQLGRLLLIWAPVLCLADTLHSWVETQELQAETEQNPCCGGMVGDRTYFMRGNPQYRSLELVDYCSLAKWTGRASSAGLCLGFCQSNNKIDGLKSTVNANAIGTFPPREREGWKFSSSSHGIEYVSDFLLRLVSPLDTVGVDLREVGGLSREQSLTTSQPSERTKSSNKCTSILP